MAQADRSFDISELNNDLIKTEAEDLKSGQEGNKDDLTSFLSTVNPTDDTPANIKLYQAGVGSGPDGFDTTIEGGTGAGTAARVKALKEAIVAIRTAYGEDVEIDLNAIGFSRGSVAIKQLLNELSEDYPNGEIHINNVLLFDPVASIGLALTDTHLGMELHYPSIADDSSRITEFYAANEYRSTFSLTAYQDEHVMRQLFPGAHSQVGGGYTNNILAAGPLAEGVRVLEAGGMELDPLPMDDVIRLRLYNAVIQSPALLSVLITDSRIISEDVLAPGSASFPVEWGQDYQFDEPSGHRGIVDERTSLSQDPLSRAFADGVNAIFGENDSGSASYLQMMRQIYGSNMSLESIASLDYHKIILPESMEELPQDVALALYDFETSLQTLSERISDARESTENPLTDSEILQMAEDGFSEISGTFAQEVGDSSAAHIASEYVLGIGTRLDVAQGDLAHEEIEMEAAKELAADRALRGAELDTIDSTIDLRDAINSGDGLDIAKEGLGYFSSLDDYTDLLHDDGNLDTEDGFLNASTEAIFDGIEHGIGLGQAIDDGDAWKIAGRSSDLLLDIDKYLDANGGGFLDRDETQILNMASSGLLLAEAIEDGDGWGIAQSTTQLLESIHTYANLPASEITGAAAGSNSALENAGDADLGSTTGSVLQGVGSAIGLATNLASLDDVLESGDGMRIAYTTVSTVNNAINTYNAVASMVDGMSTIGSMSSMFGSVPVISILAIGTQLAMGDVRGAAITAATTVLMACGPWGWAAAAVLQVANMLIGEDPPTATADFHLDANGNVVMDVSGDDEMKESAEGYASPLVAVMQAFKDQGGRLEVDGTLPSLRVEAGEDTEISYSSEYGGKVTVGISDPSRIALDMRGALYARDRADRMDDVIKLARDGQGNIDFSQVDARLAALGFSKHGITYTFGESRAPRVGQSFGTGVYNGGGNAGGPEGKTFVAKDEDIQSLGLTPEQRPAQTIAKILAAVSLKQNFAGAGGLLLAMGLGLDIDQACAAALIGETEHAETNTDSIKPLDAVELARYEREGILPEHNWGVPEADEEAIPELNSDASLHSFLTAHWPSQAAGFNPLDDPTISNVFSGDGSPAMPLTSYAEYLEYWNALPQGQRVDLLSSDELYRLSLAADAAESFSGEGDTTGQSGQISPESLPADFVAAPLAEGVSQGSVFTMPQDASLRFLPSALVNDTLSSYSSTTSDYHLISYDNAQHGTIQEDANGDIRFLADPGFVGTASFEYSLLGPNGDTIIRRALIVVEDVNDMPILEEDHFTIAEGEGFFLDQLLTNDHDPEGDPLSLDHFRGLDHGSISVVNNRLLFTPEDGFNGELDFSYWVKDRAGSYPQMGQASLTVEPRNLPPVTGDDHFITLEDQALTVTVAKLLSNDHDYDGEAIQLSSLHDARHGQVSLNPDNTITFTPDADYAGNDAGFSYTVMDDSGNPATGYAAVEVLDLREAPIVSSSNYPAINEGETITFCPEEIAKFVSDADGDQLHLDSITNIVGGTATVVNGFLSFVPDAEFHGTASFDYQANDNHRGTVQGHLEFEVNAVNDPVLMGEDSYQTAEENPLSITVADLLANDIDPEGGAVEFVGLGESSHGTVSLDAGNSILFTPAPDYAGSDAGFFYTVQDSSGLQSTAFVKVQVTDVNDAPVQLPGELSATEDQTLNFDAATLAAFVSDADGDSLTVDTMSNANGGVISEANGLYHFSPTANSYGPASLDYTVTDGRGGSVSGTLHMDFSVVDDAAILGNDTLNTMEEQPVTSSIAALMANDSDVDGSLQFAGLGAANHGTVSLDAGGVISFTPEMDYFGSDAGFTYTVQDSAGGISSGFVTVTVGNNNDAPESIAQQITLLEDQPLVLDESGLSRFLHDADADPLHISSLTNIQGGTISEQNGISTFTPDANYHGPASFDYTVDDGQGATVSGTLALDIQSVDDATSFGDDTLHTDEEQTITTSIAALMANDTDNDGALSFGSLSSPAHGSLLLEEDGSISFTPDMDYFGTTAGFDYSVEDAEGHQAIQHVQIDVANSNDAPVLLHDHRYINEDQEIVFDDNEMASFISDADGDSLQFSSLSAVQGGTLHSDNGVYTFTPQANFYGEAGFNYTVTDAAGATLSAAMAISISPVNDIPVVPGSSTTMVEDTEISFTVDSLMATASDVEDGTALDFNGISASSHGDAWLDGDGLVHFLPTADYFGNASFVYSLRDSEGGLGYGTVDIAVSGENDIPVAVDDDHIVAWSNNSYDNVYSPTTLLNNDYDVDLDPLHISALGPAEYGSISLDGSGALHYQAVSDDWVGVDSFSYTIDDGHGGQATATAEIDVKLNTSPDAYSEILFSREDIVSLLDQNELLANDSDVDGDSLFISAVGSTEHCAVSLLPDGRIQFVPEQNFNNNYPGQASFEYTVSDGISDPVTALAFVDLDPVNDAPILVGERISGAVEDNSFSFTAAQLMDNDYDIEMDSAYETDAITFTGVAGADHGSLSYNAATDTIFYNPNANFCGVETFHYQVTDSYGAMSTGTSEIYVLPVNDNPVAQEDVGSPAETNIWNMYSVAGLLGNDFDVDGDSLSIVNPYVSAGSAAVRLSGGYLQVQPGTGQRYVEVSYTVSDGHGGTAPSALILNQITEHNFAPVFTGQYGVDWARWDSSGELWFVFEVTDQNGGHTWDTGGDGDIATVSAAQVSGGQIAYWPANHSAFRFMGNADSGSLYITATDYGGATGTIFVQLSHLSRATGYYSYSPVVLDLDGDGIELLAIEDGVHFDWNRDGVAEATGWVGPDDAILVYDYDHNGVVTNAHELMLREYLPGATTDLEGLQAFDENGDGVFNAKDTAWEDFGLWQDTNSDGVTDAGEFHALDEMGVTAIDLESDGNSEEVAGNTVFGSSHYQNEDGTVGEVGDVALRGEEIVLTEVDSGQLAAESPAPDSAGSGAMADVLPATVTAESDQALSVTAEEGTAPDTEEVAGTADAVESGPEISVDAPVPDEIQVNEADISRIAHQFQSDAAAGDLVIDADPVLHLDDYHPMDAIHHSDFTQLDDDSPDDFLALAV
jgi:hypothetical protein